LLVRTCKDCLLRRIRYSTQSFPIVSTFNPRLGSILWTEGLPRRGYRTQPRVSTLGILEINGSPRRGERCGSQIKLVAIAAQNQSAQLGGATIGPSDPAPSFQDVRSGAPFRARRSWWT